jgi:RHS repeat-associated protein
MKRTLFFIKAIAVVLAVLSSTIIPTFTEASSDHPEEAIGYREGSYGLSQYETINLSNGNLTFRIPIGSVTTDGGLAYNVALIHNSKMWETRPLCMNFPPINTCSPGVPGEGDDMWVTQQIATGIESYGWGWDLRPPRIDYAADVVDPDTPTSWIDPSGAKHYLAGAPAWDHTGGQSGIHVPCVLTDTSSECFTVDGSNFRIRATAFSGSDIAEITVDSPDGTRFIHSHFVPQNVSTSDIIVQREDVRDINFRADFGGWYVTSIERAPYDGGVAANRIEFEYCNADSCPAPAWPWLVEQITAAHGPDSAQDRTINFDYVAHTYEKIPGQSGSAVTTLVLNTIDVPSFQAPGVSSQPTAQFQFGYTNVGFTQTRGRRDILVPEPDDERDTNFEAPYLSSITLPASGGTFGFQTALLNNPRNEILAKVTLPSSAEISYVTMGWPVSGSLCLGANCSIETFCDGENRVDNTPPDPEDPVAGHWNYTDGVSFRTVEYQDASGTHREVTAFAGNLTCSPDTWPYDFSGYLDPDSSEDSYFYTYVGTWNSDDTTVESLLEDLDRGTFAAKGIVALGEIHRFHGETKEEFSIDYFDASAFVIPPGPGQERPEEEIRASGGPTVVRHERIKHTEKFDVGEWVVWPANQPSGSPIESSELARYAFEERREVYTNTDSGGGNDVLSCSEAYYPKTQAGGAMNCASLTQTNTTDDYLNTTATSAWSTNWPLLSVSRQTQAWYLNDETNWYLGLGYREDVTENGATFTTGRNWSPYTNSFRYRVESEFVNPSVGAQPYACTAGDCVMRAFTYDASGNVTTETTTGGYGPEYGEDTFTTETTWAHGRQTKKQLRDESGDTLLLWEREIDPWSRLARWHVAGNGAGAAYAYDGMGRITDIAPVDGVYDANSDAWTLSGQITPSLIDGAPDEALFGTKVSYLSPTVGTPFFRHEISDANCTVAGNAPNCTAANLRERIVFGGNGHVTQVVERMPGGAFRTKFNLSLIAPDAPQGACETPAAAGLATVGRFDRSSTWISGSAWPAGGCGDPSLHWAETQVDGLGRPRRTIAPDGTTTAIDYFGDAHTVTTSSIATSLSGAEESIRRQETADAFGRMVRLWEQPAATPNYPYIARYFYDARDRLTKAKIKTTSGPQQERIFAYSPGGFLTSSTEPERTVHNTAYDALGSVRSSTISGGSTLVTEYDGFGRPTHVTTAGQTLIENVYGDALPGAGAAVGEGAYNRIVASTYTNRYDRWATGEVDVTQEWVYGGPGGRPTLRYTDIEGFGVAADAFSFGYDYDRWGNVRRTHMPGWAGCRDSEWPATVATWDGAHLTQVARENSSGSTETLGAYTYHPNGRIATTTYGNAMATLSEIPDSSGMARPQRLQLVDGSSQQTLWVNGDYTYDGAGNITGIGSKRYAYDGLSRLTDYAASGTVADESYTYDRWGNMTAVTRASGPDHTFGFDVNGTGGPANNRPSSVTENGSTTATLTWENAHGNLKAIDAFTGQRAKQFGFSVDDRLMESRDVDSETEWRYAYDTGGERIARWTDDGGALGLEMDVFIRNEGGQVLSEWHYDADVPSLAPTREYVLGHGVLAQMDVSPGFTDLHYLVHDHLGSGRVLLADNGAIAETYDFLPFGEFTDTSASSPSTTKLFTGHERDLGQYGTELDYMHARYYSPVLSRFLSPDPVLGAIASSQSWNRYAYTYNNPISFVDPDGELAFLAVPLGIGAWKAGTLLAAGGAAVIATVYLATPNPSDPDELMAESLVKATSDMIDLTGDAISESLKNEASDPPRSSDNDERDEYDAKIDNVEKSEDNAQNAIDNYDGSEMSEWEVEEAMDRLKKIRRAQNRRRQQEREFNRGEFEGDQSKVVETNNSTSKPKKAKKAKKTN